MKYIDPNGEDIQIYYRDENGDRQSHVFNTNEKYSGNNSIEKQFHGEVMIGLTNFKGRHGL